MRTEYRKLRVRPFQPSADRFQRVTAPDDGIPPGPAPAGKREEDILTLLGHELRTPLAPILTGLALVRRKLPAEEKALLDPVIQKTYQTIERQVVHLARLVDDLLDVARINSGCLELRLAAANIQDLLAQAVANSEAIMTERGHKFTVELPTEPIVVRVDAARIVQVTSNLIQNAARNTPPGGKLRLVCVPNADSVAIEVSDNGKGVTADLLPNIFDMFFQQRNRSVGPGLGLTLVKQLVDLHGGHVTASSEGPDRGSTFVMNLPIAPPAHNAMLAPPPLRLPAIPRPAQANVLAAPLRVVLVEDNPDIRSTLEDLLADLGYQVHSAVDGEAGLRLILEVEPDVALIDIGLPVLDGYGVAKAVRQRLGPHRINLIALTGLSQATDRDRALAAGFDTHLVKPTEIDHLLAAMTKPGSYV